ncbi:type III secretion system chaperone family protein [Pseudoalteromonas gelatinilytica]
MSSKIFTVLAFSLALSGFASAENKLDLAATKSDVVMEAVKKLGHKVSLHKDKEGEPHLVFTSKVEGVKDLAIFFDDCDKKGGCDDITFYANFGKVRMYPDRINGWNHIGSKNRSKAFISDDGSVGLSYTISYYDTVDPVAMLAGMFILEAELFGVALNR